MSDEKQEEQAKPKEREKERATQKAKSKQPTLARRSFISDMPDRGLFAVVAIGGFALIMVMRIQRFDPYLVAAIAIAVMIGYGVIAYRIPAIQMRSDRLGDNFYYLGFMYTLASLSAALFQLRIITTETALNDILGNFGLALITTIVGIAGRVVFVQMRMEIDEAEASVRNDILEASQRLKGQMNAAVAEFEIFRIGLQQILSERTQPGFEASTSLAQSQIDKIADIAKSASSRIESSFDSHETQARRLREMIDKTVAPTEDAIKKLGQTKIPVDEFRETLKAFTEELDGYTASIGRLVEEVRRNQRPVRWWQFRRKREQRQYG